MKLRLEPITEGFADEEALKRINDEAFPEIERIPSDFLLEWLIKYNTESWAMYIGEEMVGFAVFFACKAVNMTYMWYFAIKDSHRGKGLGTEALAMFQMKYADSQLVLDMEELDCPDAPNAEQRRKRVAFYERNGMRRAMIGITYFGMYLELMNNNGELRLDDFKYLLTTIKAEGFEPRLYPLQG